MAIYSSHLHLHIANYCNPVITQPKSNGNIYYGKGTGKKSVIGSSDRDVEKVAVCVGGPSTSVKVLLTDGDKRVYFRRLRLGKPYVGCPAAS